MCEAIPTLHVMCGKIASGKSTLSAALARRGRTVALSEDVWLAALFSEQMSSISDYVVCSARLREVAGPLVVDLLRAGNNVVLDFAANRVEDRGWMLGLARQGRAMAVLHHLDVSDATCLERLQARNARGAHPFTVSKEQFHQITAHFCAPSEDEGFDKLLQH